MYVFIYWFISKNKKSIIIIVNLCTDINTVLFSFLLCACRTQKDSRVMLQHFERDTFRLCFDPTWQGQGSRANLLHVLSVTLGGDLAAGGVLAQRACCEERHL